MSLHIDDVVPDFSADTSTDKIILHDWIATDWAFNFSHPGEFTPVCTTEIGRTAQLADAFAKRHVKPLGPSTDTVAEHLKWIKDVDEAESCFHKAGRRFGLICGPRHSEKDGVGPIRTSLNW